MARGVVTGPLLVQVVLCLVIILLLYLYWSLSGQLHSCQEEGDSLSNDRQALLTRVGELTKGMQTARETFDECHSAKKDVLAQVDELQVELVRDRGWFFGACLPCASHVLAHRNRLKRGSLA